jgi:uncharacterized protein (DUF433 family)
MKLEDYFEFEKFDTKFGVAERIRIKGHRISIEKVIELFNAGVSAELIQQVHYPTLTLDEVEATIAYYRQNKNEVEAYFDRSRKIEDGFYQEYLKQEPPPIVKRLRALRAQQMGSDPSAHE